MKQTDSTTENLLRTLPEPLLGWYRENARDLPWRHTEDPYRIWVSEIMLQQTRVAAVLGYYARFLAVFPTVEALAEADEERLMKLWEGLGYYSRARNLQKAAQEIVKLGNFPDTYEGLLALPGMELTTAEEVHVVCLLPDLEAAAAFGALVRQRLNLGENHPEFFGRQLVMDKEDHLLREETALLAGATDISVMEVPALVKGFGGVAYPAHIDRPAFSLISNLGFWLPDAGFPLAELSLRCPAEFTCRPDLAGVRFIRGCDAHALDQIPDAEQILQVSARTAQAVIETLRLAKI